MKPKVAIVGIGGVLPDAPDLRAFWHNVEGGNDAAREVPAGRWAFDPERAFDARLSRDDRVYSRRGCFVDPLVLNEAFYRGLDIDAALCQRLDPMVQLALHASRDAWHDAGYGTDGGGIATVDRSRVGVILGNIALPTDSVSAMTDWVLGRRVESALFARAGRSVPEERRSPPAPLNRWVMGLPAGMVSRSLGLGGGHCTLDAACSSSLFALQLAVGELQSGRADAMLTGGLSRPDCQYTQMGFSQLRALSARGVCASFDRSADGLVVGEGAGVVVLERLDDALRRGHHVYAVICGIGLSNDVDGDLLAPSSEGQLRAMHAAYRNAGWRPSDVDLIECHATGTPVGDAVEYQSLRELWGGGGWRRGQCVIGGVKTNVGHLLTGAGAAALLKVLLAMKHGVLPPTANFSRAPDDFALESSPFDILTSAREWVRRRGGAPRRAAVSGFGFGGTNAHVLLEEWIPEPESAAPVVLHKNPPPPIAIVGMGASVGPWRGVEVLRRRMLGSSEPHEPQAKEAFWGLEDAPRGWFIEELCVPIGDFRIPPNELAQILPQQTLMLQVAKESLDDAALGDLDPTTALRTGVFIGIGLDLNTANSHLRWMIHQHAPRWAGTLDAPDVEALTQQLCDAVVGPLNANRTMGGLGGIVASRIAREFGLGGPSYALSSEESSGFAALEAAVRALQCGQLEMAIVGGVDLCGDVRALFATDAVRPYSRAAQVRPFDRDADGTLPADGAVAIVLKREDVARRDGNRIYASIRGVGSSTGGGAADTVTTSEDCATALRRAYADAGITPDSVGYLEAYGSGDPDIDSIEAAAINEVFAAAPDLAIGSAKADVGHTGAASALVSLVKASAALYQEIVPAIRGLHNRRSSLGDFRLPRVSYYWLHDRSTGPRRAGVTSLSVSGAASHVVLEAVQGAARPEERMQPLGPRVEHLFVIEGDDHDALSRQVDCLMAVCADDVALPDVARGWWQEHGQNPEAVLGIGIVAGDVSQLTAALAAAHTQLADPGATSYLGGAPQQLFYRDDPVGREGELAFVFPGSGSQFPNMGRELSVLWPQVLRAQDAETDTLRSQFGPHLIWQDVASPDVEDDARGLILSQVALGTFVSDVMRSFGVEPHASIGYSLGETTGLFSLGVWNERGDMLARVMESELFTTELAGPCRAARRAWGLTDVDPHVEWSIGVVDRAAASVRSALDGIERAYLLIVNTPDECVVGGERRAVESLIARLGCILVPLHGVTTVHCDVVREVEAAYRQLHILDTETPAKVRFYSAAWARPYEVDTHSAADSILAQAIDGIDFPRLIERAWEDGVRVFLEIGPGQSCTRMIRRILGERRYAARSVCIEGESAAGTMLRGLAMLVSERVPVDLSPLHVAPLTAPDPDYRGSITIPVGGEAIDLQDVDLYVTAAPAPRESTPHPVACSLADGLTRIAHAGAEAHASFLLASQSAAATIARQADYHMRLTALLDPAACIAAPTAASERSCVFDRAQCLEFAVGSIAAVLGERFVPVDAHSRRVRLPDEPLMLVDRIVSIDGEALSLKPGKLVTEHDVLHDGWYLDGGRMPTAIAIEAGQADLFLSAYLGIDFVTRGSAVYRLLDAVATFHDTLPQPGDVIRYEIGIERFKQQADTWLFWFNFEASVNGRPLLSMRDGCAGFFTPSQLAAGAGIVSSRLDGERVAGVVPEGGGRWTPMQRESYGAAELDALRAGDLGAAFGPAFADLAVSEPLTIPTGKLRLVDRITDLDPDGGRYGLGRIRGEVDIHPDDWFLTCHFIDDRVMPGTLMYESCLHTLRVFLLRMGWVAATESARWEPVVGTHSRLRCRGQVTEDTRLVAYEICIKEIGYGPEPYTIADALMYADGKAIVEIADMSVRLSGVSETELRWLWRAHRPVPPFDRDRLLAFCNGKPSEAFGEPYRPFDDGRFIARLPQPPFLFIDRVTSRSGAPFEMSAGTSCEAQVLVPEDAWYLRENRQRDIPYSVLLEIALQPCGWLAAYMGSALQLGEELRFRNLGGDAMLRAPVRPGDLLTTRATCTNVSTSLGMIIQHYAFEVHNERGVVYEGTTYFGYFTSRALADQVGIPDPPDYGRPLGAAGPRDLPREAPFPAEAMRMIDVVDCLLPTGGEHGLGYIRGSTPVDASVWFFEAHFFQDPVWPGSLGLESFLQLLKAFAADRWQIGSDTRFATAPRERRHRWTYRGQILGSADRVEVEAQVSSIDEVGRRIIADGLLWVDGRPIYKLEGFGLEVLA